MFSKTSIAKAEKLRERARRAQNAISGMEIAREVLARESAQCLAEAQEIDPFCQYQDRHYYGGDTRCPKARLTPEEYKRGHCDVCEENRLRRKAFEEKRQAEADAKVAQDKERYGVYPCCEQPMKKTGYGDRVEKGPHTWDCEVGQQERQQERQLDREREADMEIRRAKRVLAKKVRVS